MAEEWGNHLVLYLYDADGSPIGMKYRTPSYAENVFDCFFFEKNLQGDIVAVYDSNGTEIASYVYTAWGECTMTYYTATANSPGLKNPFKYRGYYHDSETGWYYLQSRYYNPSWGRFISADDVAYLGANGDLQAYNLFAYCSNNPIMYTDATGNSITALLIAVAIGAVFGGIYGGVSAYGNGQNVAAGILIGAVVGGATGGLTGISSIPWMLAATFGVGFLGDVASQMILDQKSFGEVNLISAGLAGATNAVLAYVGKGLSYLDEQSKLSVISSILFEGLTNSPLLALGMAINMGVSSHSPEYTVNDLIEDITKVGKAVAERRSLDEIQTTNP